MRCLPKRVTRKEAETNESWITRLTSEALLTTISLPTIGEVAEWPNASDSKSGVRFPRTVGSNPTLSARKIKGPFTGPFVFLAECG